MRDVQRDEWWRVVAGVPSWISDGPWWGVFLFLLCVVFLRAQGTYWAGRAIRKGVDAAATSANHDDPRLHSRLARKLSGPGLDRAQNYLERWGFIGIPLSFLTIGFQTMVNAAAGYTRMRWDLYTAAMIPGCLMWAALYSALGLSIVEAWRYSPWLAVGLIVALVAAAWGFTVWRRRRRDAQNAAEPTR